ncbi:MAG TPA: alpha/beta hydrolase [Actinomycetota bacterium]|nr:alpha/beta hydrolase [Actinomycetota bacterium]
MVLFDGFEVRMIDAGDAVIRARVGGSGPPVLLLHGHPQTHVMWHRVAPVLARDFTVVAADLRGYGDSSKPPTTPDHEPYSKRAMARDQVAVMASLGFDRFSVAGHDRGAYCAYRLALDHPARVERLAILDAVPNAEVWRRVDRTFMLAWWHWAFLAQPAPLPERLIGADPEWYLTRNAERIAPWAPEALDDYLRCYRNPDTLHAICEDYRAGATIDFAHDEADRGARRVECPLLVLWGRREDLEQLYGDPLELWRTWADDVRGHGLDCAHYLAEEAPDDTAAALRAFFAGES